MNNSMRGTWMNVSRTYAPASIMENLNKTSVIAQNISRQYGQFPNANSSMF